MKFLVGYKMEGNDYITVVNVDDNSPFKDEEEIKCLVIDKIKDYDIEVKNWVLVKKKLFERNKQYLVKFKYDHVDNIQMDIVYAKNMIEAIETFEFVCKRPDRYFITAVERM